MRYLGVYKKAFQHYACLQDLTVHAQDEDSSQILPPIADLLGRRGHEPLYGKLTRCLKTSNNHFFVKTEKLDDFRSRLRATLGLRRSDGGQMWLIEELRNSVEAFRRGAPVPKVTAFGYQRRGRRLIREFFLVSEMLEGHVDGMEWLRTPGVDIEQLLRSCFALFKQLHDRDIFHLDLWLANMMLDPRHPAQLYAVDLENCHIGATRYFSEVLAFQFGFLFFRFLHEHITEARYDELVADALAAYRNIDEKRFSQIYEVVKRKPISRKKRKLLVLQGVLKTQH